jgi:hypothetical protein
VCYGIVETEVPYLRFELKEFEKQMSLEIETVIDYSNWGPVCMLKGAGCGGEFFLNWRSFE